MHNITISKEIIRTLSKMWYNAFNNVGIKIFWETWNVCIFDETKI